MKYLFGIFLSLLSAVTMALPRYGMNMHTGMGSATGNQTAAGILDARNMTELRLDTWNLAQTRDTAAKIRAVGGRVQVSAQINFQWDYTCNQNLAQVEATTYTDMTNMINSLSDLVHDFEFLNEIPLRPEINNANVVPFNSGTSASAYANKPCVASVTAALRGMSRALIDVRNATGLPLRGIMGTIGRDFGLLDHLRANGVQWDVTGYHSYPHIHHPSLLVNDPWWMLPAGSGPLIKLGSYGKPVTLNEFNCGELFDADYGNIEGDFKTENCIKALDKHLLDLRNQTQMNLESIILYDFVDNTGTTGPESRSGYMYDMSRPKVHLYVATAYAGGALSASERTAIISRGLMTEAEINSMQEQGGGPQESPHNTTIPPATNIVDDRGVTWTVSGGQIYRNGNVQPETNGVALLLYWNKVVYQQNSAAQGGNWWLWDNSIADTAPHKWVATTDPRATSSDTTNPTVSITFPANGQTFGRGVQITMTANAADNVGVARVEFASNGVIKCSDTSAPYSCTFLLPGGNKKSNWPLTARAFDAAGNSAVHQILVNTR